MFKRIGLVGILSIVILSLATTKGYPWGAKANVKVGSSYEEPGINALSNLLATPGSGETMLVMEPRTVTNNWFMYDRVVIDRWGKGSSLWNGTLAYTIYTGGSESPIFYFDGITSTYIADSDMEGWNFGIANMNGKVFWQHRTGNGSTTTGIYRWDGVGVKMLVFGGPYDSGLSVGSNYDMIWTSNQQPSLYYYTAATRVTMPMGIAGIAPSLYIKEDGVPTYAYVDPNTREVKYYDGQTTQVVGQAAAPGIVTSVELWNGTVAWIGEGIGEDFLKMELFVWKNGVTTRVTNDDAVGGIIDGQMCLWNGMLVWVRGNGFYPHLFMWDGQNTTELTTTKTMWPSFHNRQVSFVDDAEGMVLARLARVGDTNGDNAVNFGDINPFILALSNPAAYAAQFPDNSILTADINRDGVVNFADINPFVALLTGGN